MIDLTTIHTIKLKELIKQCRVIHNKTIDFRENIQNPRASPTKISILIRQQRNITYTKLSKVIILLEEKLDTKLVPITQAIKDFDFYRITTTTQAKNYQSDIDTVTYINKLLTSMDTSLNNLKS